MVAQRRFLVSPSRGWSSALGKSIPTWAGERMLEAIKRLVIWEQELIDLEYPEGDPRRTKDDSELPPEWHVERQTMRETVVFNAALVGGETEADADCYADQPMAPGNPYNLERVMLAIAMFGNGLGVARLCGARSEVAVWAQRSDLR